MRNNHFSPGSTEPFEPAEEYVTLASLSRTLKERAGLVAVVLGITALVLGAIGALVIGLQPTSTAASVVARLAFSGVDKGKYPNGTTFSPADLVDTSVMEKLYERHRLKDQVPFADFKEAFTVTNQNPALERLQREYRGVLDNRQLSVADRQKLEAEFESRTRSVMNGEYTISVSSTHPFFSRSDVVVAKLIEDVLNIWAEQSAAKGIYLYDIELYSPNIIRLTALAKDDYMVVYDQLRVTIDRIHQNLDRISTLPGANLARAGAEGVTVADLRAQLNDLAKFRLPALVGLIRQGGLSRERDVSTVYINEQLFRLNVDADALTKRREMYTRAIKEYNARSDGESAQNEVGRSGVAPGNIMGGGTTIPQFGESFINRLVELSSQNSDLAFRQDMSRQNLLLGSKLVETEREKVLYSDLLKSLGDQPVDQGRRDAMRAMVEERIQTLITEIQLALGYTQQFHAAISTDNLKPSRVFSITRPLIVTKVPSVITTKKLAFAIFGVWLLAAAGIVGYVLVFGRRHRGGDHGVVADVYEQVPQSTAKFGAVNEG